MCAADGLLQLLDGPLLLPLVLLLLLQDHSQVG
jgi:hypothetical protein